MNVNMGEGKVGKKDRCPVDNSEFEFEIWSSKRRGKGLEFKEN